MRPNLSFEQAPPLDVPLRFFASACLFGLLTALLLIWAPGEDAGGGFGHRWSPPVLAATHLVTTGFMLHIMLGALFQLTPVAVGANVWRPRLVATWTHLFACLATLVLSGAFLWGTAGYALATVLFVLALVPCIVALLAALMRSGAHGEMRSALWLALLALAFTVALGALLALVRGGQAAVGWSLFTPLHIFAGWLGWGLVLLAGVSYQVVPMFQITPPYPQRFRSLFVPAVIALLVLATVAHGLLDSAPLVAVWLARAATLGGCAAVVTWAVVTWRLQNRRRRARMDVSLRLWRLSLASFAGAAVLAALLEFVWLPPATAVSLGVLVLIGGFVSVMSAMLYKIVPFLIWLHLQKLGAAPLTMYEIISEPAMRRHAIAHAVALLLGLLLPWWPALQVPTGLAALLAFALLGGNLAQAVWRYQRARRGMAAEA